MVDRYGAPILGVGVGLVLAGAVLLFGPFVAAQRVVVTGTPSALPVAGTPVVELALPVGSRACLDTVGIGPGDEVAEIGIASRRPSRLVVELRAPGYVHRAPVRASPGPVVVPIDPPRDDVIGSVCVRNQGPSAVALTGPADPRVQSRSETTVDGAPVAEDFSLHFLARERSSLLARVPELLASVAIWAPGFLGRATLWLVLVLLTVGVAIGVPVVFAASVRREDGG